VSEIVQASGGSVSGIERWGRRPFAYELKHRNEGIYLFIDFFATAEAIAEADRFLSLSDEVLRHRVIRRPDKIAGQSPARAPETTTTS
jgi:small subunit ribosomal protein S6